MSFRVFSTTGATTWTWPTGLTSVTAECLGGGGAGGTASGNPASAGGGKGGGYARKVITKGAETTLTINVGIAGSQSSVVQGGTTVVNATSGSGAANASVNSTNGAGSIAAFGTGVGDVFYDGGNGGTGNYISGQQGSGGGGGAAGPAGAGQNASVNTGGATGGGAWGDGKFYSGPGANGVGDSTVGLAASNYGGAGSGGKANANADKAGGAGYQGIAVLSWIDPPSILTRVQATGKVRVANAASLALTLSSQPVVGNGLVLLVTGYNAGGMTFTATDVTDNRGNVWKWVGYRRITTNGEYACAVYYCGNLTATGTPFTVTVQPAASTYYFVASAIEVGGLQGKDLVLADYLSNSGSGTAVTTGNTGTINAEVFAASVLVKYQTATSIVAGVVTPVQTEEFEELDGTNWIPSEGDTRIVTLAGPASTAWTIAPTGNWAALVAAFRSVSVQLLGGVTVASAGVLSSPTVAVGPVTILGATRATTLAVTAPTVLPGPAAVIEATIPSTLVLFAPTLMAMASERNTTFVWLW